ncbi:hypothetical protein [Cupriavidus sp. UGS-1]|uniref:hypothetical protein n=1 Tax=Cupriavidus sp. UGS-1 TaxID=2899826 RepID=UPI001E2B50C9|nr:hypothetical protein [Cupriavidus sp. UGS-1]MCD9122811.1 hypothetical protein [Cupriavidus sp. UGS-1]
MEGLCAARMAELARSPQSLVAQRFAGNEQRRAKAAQGHARSVWRRYALRNALRREWNIEGGVGDRCDAAGAVFADAGVWRWTP